jgi:glucose-fructose oxidoreductase
MAARKSKRVSRRNVRARNNSRARTRQGSGNGNGGGSRRSASTRTDRKIRYAVIGLGHIAQVAVLPAFRHAARNSELAALVSDDPKKLKELGKRYRVDRLLDYDELDELYRSGEIDAVYIALPNDMHAQYTVQAAKAGMHVLCEKPMAVSSEECERMIEVCRSNRVKLMIAYRLHFERANLEAAEMARSGKLGDPRYFDSVFSFQVQEDNIRTNPEEKGGGPLYDIGIYCINAARYVMGAEPTSVLAAAIPRPDDERFQEAPETVSAILQFPDRRVGSFTCSFGAADTGTYTIVGTKGLLRMEPAYEYSEGLAYEVKIGERSRKKQFGKSDQFAPELLYFSDCILQDCEPEPSGKEGLADVRIIEAIRRSAGTGRREPVHVEQRSKRPTMQQEIRKPGIDKPKTVNVQQPH